MNRRQWLRGTAALALATWAGAPAKSELGLVIHSYWVRSKSPRPPEFPPISTPLALLEEAASLGAAGIQVKVPVEEGQGPERLREAAERLGAYVEAIVSLPQNEGDVPRFEAELGAAARSGATVARTVCLNGRRYEEFSTPEEFEAFARRSWEALARAEPIAARRKVKLAVENHKDWRTDEMVGWLKRLSSEWVGVCLDTGNGLALLEAPEAIVGALAPYTLTTHFKDMATVEAPEGFLLAEVPLGDGGLDLPGLVATLRRSAPKARLNLEMITRDPLVVPCLTPKYWATFGAVRGRELAEALARVRAKAPKRPLPRPSTLDDLGRLRAEAENVARSFRHFVTAKLSQCVFGLGSERQTNAEPRLAALPND